MAIEAQFLSKLRVEDNDGFPFELLEPLVYLSKEIVPPGKVGKITVPAGFKTDYASIPKLLWNILPPVGRYDRAAVIHDYLYQNNGVTRLQADNVLLEAMRVLNVPAWQRGMIYSGVRIGGWVTWNRYRKADGK